LGALPDRQIGPIATRPQFEKIAAKAIWQSA
jgi:hypothetical protein